MQDLPKQNTDQPLTCRYNVLMSNNKIFKERTKSKWGYSRLFRGWTICNEVQKQWGTSRESKELWKEKRRRKEKKQGRDHVYFQNIFHSSLPQHRGTSNSTSKTCIEYNIDSKSLDSLNGETPVNCLIRRSEIIN